MRQNTNESDLNSVLQNGMKKNFAEVKVTVVDCPDLTKKPFMLADKGNSCTQKQRSPVFTPIKLSHNIFKVMLIFD